MKRKDKIETKEGRKKFSAVRPNIFSRKMKEESRRNERETLRK